MPYQKPPEEAHEEIMNFCEEEGAEIDRFLGRTNDDPLVGADKRNQRVEDAESEARRRYSDYDQKIARVEAEIRQAPWIFEVLRNTFDPAEVGYQMGRYLEDARVLDEPGLRGFVEYLGDVYARVKEGKTGKYDNASVEEMEWAIEEFKNHAEDDETVEDFFSRRLRR
jgi:hypothetical protein